MSVKDALDFMQRVRQDPLLQARLRDLGVVADLSGAVQLGAEAGFNFTDDDLQQAYRHDWSLRWLRAAPEAGRAADPDAS